MDSNTDDSDRRHRSDILHAGTGHARRIDLRRWIAQRFVDAAAGTDDVRSLLGLHHPLALAIAGFFSAGIVSEALMARTATGSSLWLFVLAVVSAVTSCFVLIFVEGDPMPLWATVSIVVASFVAVGTVMLWPPIIDYSNQVWVISIFVPAATFLCVRGRGRWAWSLITGAVGIAAVWGILTGSGPLHGVNPAVVNYCPLVMATFFARWFRPAALDIYRLQQEGRRRAELGAKAEFQIANAEVQLAALDALARPLLERATHLAQLTQSEKMECRIAEELLRAQFRAPGLDDPRINPAVAAALRRGVRVRLFDENGMDVVTEPLRAGVLRAVASDLDSAESGQVTIRIVPRNRTQLVTVVIQDGSYVRSIEYDLAGGRHERSAEPGRSFEVPQTGETA
ncbi:hypothetical protein ACFV24_25720 [Nocardia fluminea]|uniref:hypothetical protein n=1 Tax=Nocardia fluminea TaxID=134984 RepID=UPI0036719D1B